MKLICTTCGEVHSAGLPHHKNIAVSTSCMSGATLPYLNVYYTELGVLHQHMKCQCPRCEGWTVTIEDDDPVVEQPIKRSPWTAWYDLSFMKKVLNYGNTH